MRQGGGVWPQARLHAVGLIATPICKACGEQDGTAQHRYWGCAALDALRPLTTRDWRPAPDEELTGVEALLLTRALVPHPAPYADGPAKAHDFQFEVNWGPRWPDGDAHGDGSFYPSACSELGRAGWGVVQLGPGPSHAVRLRMWGPLPGPVQTTLAAEAMALWAFVRHLAPRPGLLAVEFSSDCSWVVGSYQAGKEATCHAAAVHADIWLQIWREVARHRDKGIRVDVGKVMGHACAEDVRMGRSTARQRAAHEAADASAKQGARCHAVAGATLHAAARAALAVQTVGMALARFAVAHVDAGPTDTDPRPPGRPRRRFGGRRRDRTEEARRHVPQLLSTGRWRCRACLRTAAKATGLSVQPCRGWRGHSLFHREDLLICRTCCAVARVRAIRLLRPCPGEATTQARARWRREEARGLQPYVGGAPSAELDFAHVLGAAAAAAWPRQP